MSDDMSPDFIQESPGVAVLERSKVLDVEKLPLREYLHLPVFKDVVTVAEGHEWLWTGKLLNKLAEHSNWKAKHEIRDAYLASRIAHIYQLSQERTERLIATGLIHDYGFKVVPTETMDKIGLDWKDKAWIRQHVNASLLEIKQHDADGKLSLLVANHHLSDGYSASDLVKVPDFVRENPEIQEDQLIFEMCDKVDALVSTRPYKEGWSDSLQIIKYLSNLLSQYPQWNSSREYMNILETIVEERLQLEEELRKAA